MCQDVLDARLDPLLDETLEGTGISGMKSLQVLPSSLGVRRSLAMVLKGFHKVANR
jgi:hypothetical protein